METQAERGSGPSFLEGPWTEEAGGDGLQNTLGANATKGPVDQRSADVENAGSEAGSDNGASSTRLRISAATGNDRVDADGSTIEMGVIETAYDGSPFDGLEM